MVQQLSEFGEHEPRLSGRASARSRRRKLRSSVLSVTFTSPRRTARRRPAGAPRQHSLHVTWRRAVAHARLAASAGEGVGAEDRCGVHERARDRGDRDAEHHSRLARVNASAAAGEDALNASFASRRRRRRLPARRLVTDPVDAAIHDDQRAGADAPVDRGG
jgi:hypothetical protein